MRATSRFLLLIVAACGGASQPVQPPKPSGPVTPTNVTPQIDPIIVAVMANDHVKVLALAPTGVTVKRDVKLPTAPEQVRWLDTDHIVAVDDAGHAYLVTGDRVDAYRMPPPSAWNVKSDGTSKRSDFPFKLSLARTNAGVELASCATYWEGDDDPCVTWAIASLGSSLDVGEVTEWSEAPEDEGFPQPEITHARTESPVFEWNGTTDGPRTNVALHTSTARREWSAPEPCPFSDAEIKWLSETPPIIAFVTTTDCGEGAPNVEEHLLRVPSLVDFSADGATIVLAPTLWAHSSDDGWKLQSGESVVGTLDSMPIRQPQNAPASVASEPPEARAPTVSQDRLALKRGEKLRSPSIETEWKTSAGAMHATVVDVSYKKKKNKPPITKLVVWGNGRRHDIVRSRRACDAFADVHPGKDNLVVFRCGISPVGNEPEGTIEDWLIRWNDKTKSPLRNKHWSGDPAASEPAWAQSKTGKPKR